MKNCSVRVSDQRDYFSLVGKQETRIGKKTQEVRDIQRQGSQLERLLNPECAEDKGGAEGGACAAEVNVNIRERKGEQAVKGCLKAKHQIRCRSSASTCLLAYLLCATAV